MKDHSIVEFLSNNGCLEIELPKSIGDDVARRAMCDQRLHFFTKIDLKNIPIDQLSLRNDRELLTKQFTLKL